MRAVFFTLTVMYSSFTEAGSLTWTQSSSVPLICLTTLPQGWSLCLLSSEMTGSMYGCPAVMCILNSGTDRERALSIEPSSHPLSFFLTKILPRFFIPWKPYCQECLRRAKVEQKLLTKWYWSSPPFSVYNHTSPPSQLSIWSLWPVFREICPTSLFHHPSSFSY